MTPAETLREAARVVREHAANVSREVGLKAGAALPAHLWFQETEDYQDAGDATHAWIALVGPHIGPALADLFEPIAVALQAGQLAGNSVLVHRALALARAILREQG